ncbi:hypothetical protein [Sphingomonas melonis]
MNKLTDIQDARELRVVAIDGAQGVILPADLLALASGQMEEAALADWLRGHIA